jgi:hypothetical protein
VADEISKSYKASKKNTDTCIDELNRIKNPEPIAIPICENLLRSVLAWKDNTL